MGQLEQLLKALNKSTDKNNEIVQKGVCDFGQFLRQQSEIRFIVAGTNGYGHQSSTVYIVKRLIEQFQYDKQIRIIYVNQYNNPEKLSILFPGVKLNESINEQTISYGTCPSISFLDFASATNLEPVTFGFTGGLDDINNKTIGYLTKINAQFFLCLQPYRWEIISKSITGHSVESVIEVKQKDDKYLLLNINDYYKKTLLLGYTFNKETVRNVPQNVWKGYEKSLLKFNVKNADETLKAIKAKQNVKLWPIYGFHGFTNKAEILLNILIICVRYNQQYNKQDPIVLLILHDANDVDDSLVNPLIDGNRGNLYKVLEETYNNQYAGHREYNEKEKKEEIVQPIINQQKLRDFVDEFQEFQISFEDNVSIFQSNIEKTIKNLKEQSILVLPIGSQPPEIFNYFYAIAQMPGIFEGQATLSLAASLGKPFFQLPKVSGKNGYYPEPAFTTEFNYTEIGRECANVSNIIRKQLSNYISENSNENYLQSVDLVVEFINTAYSEDTKLYNYFKLLQQSAEQPLYDKFSVGLALLNASTEDYYKEINFPLTESLPGETVKPPLTLKQIYDNLINTWKDDQVNLFAALPDSHFSGFYRSITGDSFSIKIDKSNIITKNDASGNISQVLLTDATTSAFGPDFTTTIEFVEEFDNIVSNLKCRIDDSWNIEGVPWISFETPGFDMRVFEAAVPVQGGVVGSIKCTTNLTVDINYPVVNNQWIITGIFESPYPNISDFYQIAGGINLLESLPEPFNAWATLGLQEVQTVYDSKNKNLSYFLFIFTINTPWQLLPGVTVTGIQIQTIIQSPGDIRNRSVSYIVTGNFTIGEGTIQISTSIPGFTVQGVLSKGSIQLGDLFKLFLPGVDVHLDLKAAITNFNFTVNPPLSSFSVNCTVDTNWELIPKLFTITRLSFEITGTDGFNLGSFSGTTLIGSADGSNIELMVVVIYQGKNQGWLVESIQKSGEIPISTLIKEYLDWDTKQTFGIDGLSVSIETNTSHWSLTGKTAKPWNIEPLGLCFTASMAIGKNKSGKYGSIAAEIKWDGNIALKVFYTYGPAPEDNSYGIRWKGLTGKITENNEKHQIAELKFNDTFTLGSVIETMVSWVTSSHFGLSEPWDLLNDISLSGISLVYDFTDKTVGLSIDINSLDIGIARVSGIALTYGPNAKKPGKKSVTIQVKGFFPWETTPSAPLSWDATQPETAPAPSGQGNQYLDLRLLAMGQHVRLSETPVSNIKEAIAAMEALPATETGQIPAIHFAPDSSWLFGTDFGLLRLEDNKQLMASSSDNYLLTMQAVFNDPQLYGLRLALAGKPAKILSGLEFEIRYQRVSDGLGVFQSELNLPTLMRRFDIGAYSLTMPSFGIEIYTNGDFKIDVGFPYNQDFSRSFSVEALIPPGIPVIGSGGVYFGKLSSASTDKVPVVTNGTFNPVLVFGFGMQLGVGKSIDKGILKAGLSLTILGIIEGALAKWNPYHQTTTPVESSDQLQGDYYFHLTGTLGIQGKVYGSVDFVVIKADVHVVLNLLLQADYQSYESMALSVIASIDAAAHIKVNLWLKKITINYSFSTRIKETLTFKNKGNAPWQIPEPQTKGLLAKSPSARLWALQSPSLSPVTLNWANLAAPAQKTAISGYVGMGLSMVGDKAGIDLKQQSPCYVALLFLDSTPPADTSDLSSALKAMGAQEDSPFESLCKQVTRWVIAAIQTKSMTDTEVDALVVTEEQLKQIQRQLANSKNLEKIPVSDIETFLASQFQFTFSQGDDQEEEADAEETFATIFPVPGLLELDIPAYGSQSAIKYTFADYNSIGADYLNKLDDYFAALQVQVQNSQNSDNALLDTQGQEASVSAFIFGEYFLFIARQMVQNLLEGLRNFKYPLQEGQSLSAIVQWVNNNGQFKGEEIFTVSDLLTANATHNLQSNQPLNIGYTYTPQATDTFESISEIRFERRFTAYELAAINIGNVNIIQPGVVITFEEKNYTTKIGDTLAFIASQVNAKSVATFLNFSDVLSNALFRADQSVWLPVLTYQNYSQSATSFSAILEQDIYKGYLNLELLALCNSAIDILQPGVEITYPDKTSYQIQPGDLLSDVAIQWEVSLENLVIQVAEQNIIRPLAVLLLPAFARTIIVGDALQSVIDLYGVSMELLAESNDQTMIFDNNEPYLNLPHLPQFSVGELIAEAQRCLMLQHLSGMISRYYMAGLRLPTDGINPKHPGMWVTDDNKFTDNTPTAGLYALTGQQFLLPDIGANPFTITLSNSDVGKLPWLAFSGSNSTKTTTTFKIEKDSDAYNRIQAVKTYAQAQALDTGTVISTGEMVALSYPSYPLTTTTVWQAAGTVSLPYGTKRAGVASLCLRALPDTMVNLPGGDRKIDPRFELKTGLFNEATGGMQAENLEYYGWATTIEFTIKSVPVDNDAPTTQNTYEIVGASGNGILMMERLIDQLDSDGSIHSLFLGYPPQLRNDTSANKISDGLQSDDNSQLTIGIAQVNLSTETAAETLSATPTLEAVESGQNLLNTPLEMIQLLWEASITRQGGFFLYYYNTETKTGLPGWIFDDNQEARIQLIVLYHKPTVTTDENRLKNYMNSVAIGQFIRESENVFAQVSSEEETVTFQSEDSLAKVTYSYYANIHQMALDNKDLTLDTGVEIKINEGSYLVREASPLSTIATHFNVSEEAIKTANKEITDWPSTLPEGWALKLPPIDLKIESTTTENTLDQISKYYNANLTGLAVDNQDKALFATGTKLTVQTGPQQFMPMVPPGVMSLLTERPVPPAVPASPSDPDYAKNYLLNNFSLLHYQVGHNFYFNESPYSLPATPMANGNANNVDKIRSAISLTEGNTWNYSQATPYTRFLSDSSGQGNTTKNLYGGIGDLLQLNFAWLDVYGNRMITDLSGSVGKQSPLSPKLLLTGYTDALLGVNQWPSISSNWQLKLNKTKQSSIFLNFNFSPEVYQGLISANATNATTVTVTFTGAVKKKEATVTGNYQLTQTSNHTSVVIQTAALSADGKTVTLTTGANLIDNQIYQLRVSGVSSTGDLNFSGKASLLYAAQSQVISSTVRDNAQQSLPLYSQLLEQFTNPNNTTTPYVSFSIQTSLLTEPISLADTEAVKLIAWLQTIEQFVGNRASGSTTVAEPKLSYQIESVITMADIYSESQIFKLSLSFVIKRNSGNVYSDLRTTADIAQVSSPVSILTDGANGSDQSLLSFAQDFETAFQQEAYELKIATGIDRSGFSTLQDGKNTWVVKLARQQSGTDKNGIHYAIQNVNQPAIFARQPISNQLESRSQVDIYEYTTGKGISTKATPQNFVNIDLDIWWAQLVSALDNILTPKYTAAIQLLGKSKSNDKSYLQLLLETKKELANIVKDLMIPVFQGDTSNPDCVRELFYQQLLVEAQSAYTTRAAIEFQAKVEANIKESSIATTPPRLFGGIVDNLSENTAIDNATLTSPKLELKEQDNQPLSFLLTSDNLLKGSDGEIVSAIDLDLSYHGSAIEHQIGTISDVEGYQPSSWLGFVVPDKNSPLIKSLGQFTIPQVLFSYPELPTMLFQQGQAVVPTSTITDLSTIAKWNYEFTYSQSFHYPQDIIHCQVTFNSQTSADTAVADSDDAFAELAEFVSVYPAIEDDLNNKLAKIDDPPPQNEKTDAKIALESFIIIITKVLNKFQEKGITLSKKKALDTADTQYQFQVQEGEATIDNTPNVFVITIHGKPPSGIGASVINLEGYSSQTYTGGSGDYSYYYEDAKGQKLLAADAESIQNRTVVVQDIDIFSWQSASASSFVKRNEWLIPKQKIADPFIYTTDNVQFTNSCHPNVEYTQTIDIASIGSGKPVKRTLQEQLSNMFTSLLKGLQQEVLTFQINAAYQYQLNANLRPVSTPILMQPPLDVNVQNSNTQNSSAKDLTNMISDLSAGLQNWLGNSPSTEGAELWIDLIVMSNQTQQPMPLLRIHNLVLAIKDIGG